MSIHGETRYGNSNPGTPGGSPTFATNADWVAKTAVDVALTPGTMLNAGVLNWLFDTSIDAGDADGSGNRVNLKLVNGGIRADGPEGTSFLGFSGTGQGLVFAGDGSTWLSLSAGSSPGFQATGAIQWGSFAEGDDGVIVDSIGFQRRSILGNSLMRAAYGGFSAETLDTGDFTSQSAEGWVQGTDSGLYVGQLKLAGASAGMYFQNGGAPVPITSDGGGFQFDGYLSAPVGVFPNGGSLGPMGADSTLWGVFGPLSAQHAAIPPVTDDLTEHSNAINLIRNVIQAFGFTA